MQLSNHPVHPGTMSDYKTESIVWSSAKRSGKSGNLTYLCTGCFSELAGAGHDFDVSECTLPPGDPVLCARNKSSKKSVAEHSQCSTVQK